MSDSLLDLRRAGAEAKRVHDHKAKWAYGSRSARSHHDPVCALPLTRPAMPVSHNMNLTRAMRFDRKSKTNQQVSDAKIALRADVREALDNGPSDSSSEDVDDPAAAEKIIDESDAKEDTPTDYDVSGQTILSVAVSKAVEKFEIKETERIVKEYEIITPESEMAIGYLADDDFELVDHVQL
ncbi:hypothetical protein BO70DRAFT_97112 [Aspergillus heteromorphus CBS 117.55]|uniref:Uncharacterized protein n=1 Tax=Aspergillus heteromorphus CBS 117.55 TaxID=1448321 RepID=A0A317VU96_9EURO|nr:uncharacterized protein BO70DRAFT_97112 [Aspergillus heteromorphus CBS 117.55]PWY75440.1 hypothetical protein BO70DRAFT_97112 [Aspergillus heteromorphus CBS 117.55]